jgi:hypothetical protein
MVIRIYGTPATQYFVSSKCGDSKAVGADLAPRKSHVGTGAVYKKTVQALDGKEAKKDKLS